LRDRETQRREKEAGEKRGKGKGRGKRKKKKEKEKEATWRRKYTIKKDRLVNSVTLQIALHCSPMQCNLS
jgi:hypothetical protein